MQNLREKGLAYMQTKLAQKHQIFYNKFTHIFLRVTTKTLTKPMLVTLLKQRKRMDDGEISFRDGNTEVIAAATNLMTKDLPEKLKADVLSTYEKLVEEQAKDEEAGLKEWAEKNNVDLEEVKKFQFYAGESEDDPGYKQNTVYTKQDAVKRAAELRQARNAAEGNTVSDTITGQVFSGNVTAMRRVNVGDHSSIASTTPDLDDCSDNRQQLTAVPPSDPDLLYFTNKSTVDIKKPALAQNIVTESGDVFLQNDYDEHIGYANSGDATLSRIVELEKTGVVSTEPIEIVVEPQRIMEIYD
jgi:hypothetical protein